MTSLPLHTLTTSPTPHLPHPARSIPPSIRCALPAWTHILSKRINIWHGTRRGVRVQPHPRLASRRQEPRASSPAPRTNSYTRHLITNSCTRPSVPMPQYRNVDTTHCTQQTRANTCRAALFLAHPPRRDPAGRPCAFPHIPPRKICRVPRLQCPRFAATSPCSRSEEATGNRGRK